MPDSGFDLSASARQEMIEEGFDPDWDAATREQVTTLKAHPAPPLPEGVRDLRQLLWSSIDNDSSRDLDQIEFAEPASGGTRILIGIADVDTDVPIGSAIDRHAAAQTTSVYTAVRTFPMLPEELSTDITSLNENTDRLAVVVEMIVDSNGAIVSSDVYRALVRNQAQLAYSSVGAWLEAQAPPPAKISRSTDLQAQLKLQDQAARALRDQRDRLGALEFDRIEPEAVTDRGRIQSIEARRQNRASHLIEDFMIAANESMASTLTRLGYSNIRRVVRSPERWPRIVALAASYGATLPADPDSGALAAFLREQKQKDPLHYPDVSLAIIKLMGPGEYVLSRPGEPAQGHFGLAAHDYTHSTAPNRRFSDLVTQRLIKAALLRAPSPYSDAELSTIAQNCTLKEDAARKVERAMNKRAAAVAYHDRVGQSFDAIVTGVTPKGTFVRVTNPPIEGRVMRGERGLDVGDKVRVVLLDTDPQRGYIDFAH